MISKKNCSNCKNRSRRTRRLGMCSIFNEKTLEHYTCKYHEPPRKYVNKVKPIVPFKPDPIIKYSDISPFSEQELSNYFYRKLSKIIGKRIKFTSTFTPIPIECTVESYTFEINISYGGELLKISPFNSCRLILYIKDAWCDSSGYYVEKNTDIEILDDVTHNKI